MAHAASPAQAELATQGRRLAGFILDALLFIFTLGLGWLIWFLVIAGRGQTPAKQIIIQKISSLNEAIGLFITST